MRGGDFRRLQKAGQSPDSVRDRHRTYTSPGGCIPISPLTCDYCSSSLMPPQSMHIWPHHQAFYFVDDLSRPQDRTLTVCMGFNVNLLGRPLKGSSDGVPGVYLQILMLGGRTAFETLHVTNWLTSNVQAAAGTHILAHSFTTANEDALRV